MEVPHLPGDHPQLLKVDQALHVGVVAEMNERQVLLDNREKRHLEKDVNEMRKKDS